MKFLTEPLLEINEYRGMLESILNYTIPITVVGPSDSQKAHIIYSICKHTHQKAIFMTFNEMQARKMYEDFSCFWGDGAVLLPSRELMLYDIDAKSNDILYSRIVAIDRIIRGEYDIVIISAETAIQYIIEPELFKNSIIEFNEGERIFLENTVLKLVEMGYERVGTVENKGQFALRGGILDLFPVNFKNPVRIELFDDEVDTIRIFDSTSQRSFDKMSKVRVIPAREIIYSRENRKAIIDRIKNEMKEYIKGIKGGGDFSVKVEENIKKDLDALKNQYYFPGIDRYIPHIIYNSKCIFDYIGKQAMVFVDEPNRIKQRIDNILLEHYEICKGLMEKGKILPSALEIFMDHEKLLQKLEGQHTVDMNTLPVGSDRLVKSKVYSIASRLLNSYERHTDMLIEEVRRWKQNKNRIIILAGTEGRGQKLCEELKNNGIEAAFTDERLEKVMPGQVVVIKGALSKGFEYPSAGLIVISDSGLFGQKRKAKRTAAKKVGSKISTFTDLNVGDFVVHQTHGIGIYEGIQKLSVDNIKRDYLKIRYQDGAYLYIPTNQLDIIQKYIGSEGKTPKINKLGGGEWVKTKKKVKESLKQLAEELVKLYAQRQAIKGFTFLPDTVWQKQFEELFPYEETEDQLRCIEEIKGDMENQKPMDRLLCGDVGYGKTEVAVRAIFKAVMSGKQVAYLVPTTILAQQQYANFKERMKDFPVKIDVISRFRTKSEQKEILKGIKNGSIDVLVGTHRLIQDDIKFKDLGLLVIDEEQRFGVANKEKLKNIRPDIDVLTLTATPIPRTLHMSLSGIRDISTIEEPPEERYPVQTYVMEHDPEVIRDAITRELARNGQVFYLYNQVRTIQLKASEIQAMMPEAKVAFAHGQMAEKQLEDIMFSFLNKEYDILVCTTIIESGLDMPNVNTIIVEDADRMGLAQLYQLRGRVGRSNRLAYAYITYKKDKVLSEIAEKRLQAIREFTEFGSGFKIAMRDLEIRGAGNLLGPEQHGHLETVGYDMYCRLLDEAVRELKGETFSDEAAETTIDINVSAYIDDLYIDNESQKVQMYKKIASIEDEQDVLDIEDEMIDRYGDLPAEVRNLVKIAYIKSLAQKCGFVSIQEKNSSIILQYNNKVELNIQTLGKLMDKYRRRILFTANNSPYITFKIDSINRDNLLDNIKILLQDIINLQ